MKYIIEQFYLVSGEGDKWCKLVEETNTSCYFQNHGWESKSKILRQVSEFEILIKIEQLEENLKNYKKIVKNQLSSNSNLLNFNNDIFVNSEIVVYIYGDSSIELDDDNDGFTFFKGFITDNNDDYFVIQNLYSDDKVNLSKSYFSEFENDKLEFVLYKNLDLELSNKVIKTLKD